MLRKEFEALVERTVAELPQRFREKLENVAIIVEDYPSEELLDRMEIEDDETLFGLYDSGRMRLVAAMHSPEALRRILECLGLPSRAPPVSPARRSEIVF